MAGSKSTAAPTRQDILDLIQTIEIVPADKRTTEQWQLLVDLFKHVAGQLAQDAREYADDAIAGWQAAKEWQELALALQAKRGRPPSTMRQAKAVKAVQGAKGKPGRSTVISDTTLNRIIKAERSRGRDPQQAELAQAISRFLLEQYGATLTTKTLKHRLSALGIRPAGRAGQGLRRGPQSRRK